MKQFSDGGRNYMAVSCLIMFFLASVSAKAMDLQYYGVESTINDDLSVKTVLTVRFAEPVQSAEFALDYKAFNLTATASADSVSCRLDESTKSRIICSFSGMTADKNLLTLAFYSKEGFIPVPNKYSFSSDFAIGSPIKDSSVLIKIPANSVLSEEQPNMSYSPQDGKILSNGKNIMVYWERTNITSGDSMIYSVSYTPSTPVPTNNNLLIVSVAGIVIIAMIGAAIYVRRGYGSGNTAEVMTSVLNSDENRVVDILAKHGGKSGQKIIVRESDFSKAKVSRLVRNLKDRGVVDIEPISGRENRIILKFDKKPEQPEQPEPKKTEQKIEKPQPAKDPVIETESYTDEDLSE